MANQDIKSVEDHIITQRGLRKSYNIKQGLSLLQKDQLTNSRVLEVACGEGMLSIYLSQYCREIIGVDILQSSIDKANENAKKYQVQNCEFVASDILQTNYEKESFDLIVAEAALHHIIYDFRIGARLCEYLKPGGRLVFITEPLAYNLFSEGMRFLRHHRKHAFGEFSLWYEHVAEFGKDFSSIEYFYFDIFSHPFKMLEKLLPGKLFLLVMKHLWAFDEFLFSNFKGLRKYAPNVNIVMHKAKQ